MSRRAFLMPRAWLWNLTTHRKGALAQGAANGGCCVLRIGNVEEVCDLIVDGQEVQAKSVSRVLTPDSRVKNNTIVPKKDLDKVGSK